MHKNSNALTFVLMTSLAIFLASGTTVSAITVVSFTDDFESEALQLNYTGFANWSVSNGTVDTVGPTFGTPLIDCQGSQVCVDVDGSTNDAGELSTIDDFAAGAYTLSFDISGSQRVDTNTITVLFGNLDESFTLAGSDAWRKITRAVTLDSPDDLTFLMTGGDNSGILLDNVSVAPVPLPAAVWLLGSALLVIRKRVPYITSQ